MPFTYSEYIKHYEENGLNLPQIALQDYIRFGGMPQRLDYSSEEDIKEYLNSIYYGIVEKDICNSKAKIDKSTFITISRYIISNASKEFSSDGIVEYYNKQNSDFIYRETVHRYLEKINRKKSFSYSFSVSVDYLEKYIENLMVLFFDGEEMEELREKLINNLQDQYDLFIAKMKYKSP